jgi:hypothetical protein
MRWRRCLRLVFGSCGVGKGMPSVERFARREGVRTRSRAARLSRGDALGSGSRAALCAARSSACKSPVSSILRALRSTSWNDNVRFWRYQRRTGITAVPTCRSAVTDHRISTLHKPHPGCEPKHRRFQPHPRLRQAQVLLQIEEGALDRPPRARVVLQHGPYARARLGAVEHPQQHGSFVAAHHHDPQRLLAVHMRPARNDRLELHRAPAAVEPRRSGAPGPRRVLGQRLGRGLDAHMPKGRAASPNFQRERNVGRSRSRRHRAALWSFCFGDSSCLALS